MIDIVVIIPFLHQAFRSYNLHMDTLLLCRHCGADLNSVHLSKKYCDWRCKKKYLMAHGRKVSEGGLCRQCGKTFPKGPQQNAKTICSEECRKARQAESVRTFHVRRPAMTHIYRRRTREKCGPDSNLKRFFVWNPTAPRACEACGEHRVIEVAHKPDTPRLGERRCRDNYKWPELVWVLCPTCHKLLDRMNYTPEELGLIK